MKKHLKPYPDKCIACRACESVCSKLYFKEDNAEKSNIRINENPAGNDINVCNQCRVCVGMCPTLALKVNLQGVVMLDKNLCISCYMCIAACPTNSMRRFIGGMYPFKCVACGMCAKECPTEAIDIVQE